MENSLEVPQKIKINYQRIQQFHSGYSAEESENTRKDISTPIFIAALFTIAKIMEITKVPIDRRIDKECMVSTYNGIYLNHKRE